LFFLINLQSTLAYHDVDSEKPFAFSIQTKGRTYKLVATSEVEMRSWIEVTMQAALGIIGDKKRGARVLDVSGASWVKVV
jgi:hypothetical protein